MQENQMIQALDACTKRREERRAFLRTASSSAVAAGGLVMLSGCFDDGNDFPSPDKVGTPTPTPGQGAQLTDADILNFALNLEYLEAQFYSFAAFGTGLDAGLLGGTGTPGQVTGGRKVAFTDPVVARYAVEIAQDEVAHVRFLRQALGGSAVAQPAIDVGASATGAFSSAARAAGLVGANQAFDPYSSDENFLLGAFIFEDVGVTAYKGAAPLITSKTFLEAAAGILAAEAYHAGLVRTVLYAKGVQTPTLRDATESISDARDGLDGATDLDQGVRTRAGLSNIVPTDDNGVAFSRTTGQVLNIAYLSRMAVDRGGFFPAGVNGNIKTSTAN
jgi:hypothetical protein